MVQLVKSTKDFEIFGAQPWPGYFMKPATTSADNGTFSVQKSIFGPECISIRFRPKNRFLNSPFGPEKSPFSALSLRSFMKCPGWHRQGEHRKFKSRSDFSQMLHFGTRNYRF